jgi:hypothetical protein
MVDSSIFLPVAGTRNPLFALIVERDAGGLLEARLALAAPCPDHDPDECRYQDKQKNCSVQGRHLDAIGERPCSHGASLALNFQCGGMSAR